MDIAWRALRCVGEGPEEGGAGGSTLIRPVIRAMRSEPLSVILLLLSSLSSLMLAIFFFSLSLFFLSPRASGIVLLVLPLREV